MKKKALPVTFVVVLMLFLLITLSLFFFVNNIFGKTKESVVEKKCEVSVDREAYVNLASVASGREGYAVSGFARNVDCVTIPVVMPEESQQKIVGVTGAFMEKCWKMFGEGSLELFSKGDGIFCHYCYVLAYEGGVSLSGLMTNNFVPFDAPEEVGKGRYAVIFRYQKTGLDVSQRVYLRPVDNVGVCDNAEFPRERVT